MVGRGEAVPALGLTLRDMKYFSIYITKTWNILGRWIQADKWLRIPARRVLSIVGVLLTLCLGLLAWFTFYPTQTEAAWLNPSWAYRLQLTFNNSGQSSALTNFPVMVHLTASNFDFNKANVTGGDIRFTDSDGTTLLDHMLDVFGAEFFKFDGAGLKIAKQ